LSNLVLFWHRRDLRLTDNLGLWAAQTRSPRVIGVFCFDPAILDAADLAPARVVFLLTALAELQDRYRQLGGDLIFLHQPPVQGIPALATALGAIAVYWNRDVEPYGRQRDRDVAAALKEQGIEFHAGWDQLLHAPGEVVTGAGNPYTVYTPFWKNWRSRPKASPVDAPPRLEPLIPAQRQTVATVGAIDLPTAADWGYTWSNPLNIPVGEQMAAEQLEAFCQDGITDYDPQRNFPAQPGTSRLSAALKFGTLGIRQAWAASEISLDQCCSDEQRRGIEVWQQELGWREFYQHVLFFFPELAEGAYRPLFKQFPWNENQEHFQAWCAGQTGYPMVDAAMRQLNQTGWMHNRCRMIVASFLTKDLILDWRWGERYFMQTLCDGDLAANNGGWQWSASSGMDPKPLRIFNPASQAQKFDPEADYIRTWVPELRSLETKALITGNISPLERHACGYPDPIVDHRIQQQDFKARYTQQKVYFS
jgi:deoxyribodipyrimidine photo-lyase